MKTGWPGDCGTGAMAPVASMPTAGSGMVLACRTTRRQPSRRARGAPEAHSRRG
ncbi:hypothetical protein ACFFX0_09740 [Citricoccus parietis]|uniref:Uncharacterized protein n=1 Tax=Citricoccus parietis TaxID=592307 RepID=A0ABV5FXQ6_9MICC